jgi:predicted GNAT superfamily acetyltransferase
MADTREEYVAVEIPARIGLLQQHDPEAAIMWREATRRAFTYALSAGYLVEEFYRQGGSDQPVGVYLLSYGKKLEDL